MNKSHPNPQLPSVLRSSEPSLSIGLTNTRTLKTSAAYSLEPFWTGNHGNEGHAVMAGCRLVDGGGLRVLQAGAGSHKLSLYLGHWDAPAATSTQDTIMQEEG